MPTETDEIIETIAAELQIPKSQLLEQSLKTFLNRQLRQCEADILQITGEYGVSSVDDMETRYREGTLEEADSWTDLQRLDHLEYRRDRLMEWLHELG
ncbi:MAG: hypothetical protein ABEL51_06285 [Salinibacter sp.]